MKTARALSVLVCLLITSVVFASGDPAPRTSQKPAGAPRVRDGFGNSRWGESSKAAAILREEPIFCSSMLKPMFDGDECRRFNASTDFTMMRASSMECLLDKDVVVACVDVWEYGRGEDAAGAVAQLREQLGAVTRTCSDSDLAQLGLRSDCSRWDKDGAVRVLIHIHAKRGSVAPHDQLIFVQGASARAKPKKSNR